MAKMTLDQFADRLKRASRDLDKAIKPVIGARMKLARKELREEITRGGLGRALWAKGKSRTGKPKLIIKSRSARWSRSAQAWTASIGVSGVSAMIERGGRIKRHVIKPRESDGVLAFQAAGQTIMTRRVDHPGAMVTRRPTLQRVMAKQVRPLKAGLLTALGKFFGRVLR